jgi:hypothetical protein
MSVTDFKIVHQEKKIEEKEGVIESKYGPEHIGQ